MIGKWCIVIRRYLTNAKPAKSRKRKTGMNSRSITWKLYQLFKAPTPTLLLRGQNILPVTVSGKRWQRYLFRNKITGFFRRYRYQPGCPSFRLLYWRKPLKAECYLPNCPSAPKTAIMPMPISMAVSSILKVGVCTPDVMPLSLFAVPSR